MYAGKKETNERAVVPEYVEVQFDKNSITGKKNTIVVHTNQGQRHSA